MPIDNSIDITLEELKTIIHGLRMSTFSFVEDGAADEIKAMIKALPLSEQIDKLTRYPSAIKNLQRDVGNIMRLVELYGKRDVEFKTRYISRTGLPPRYKVLDWKEKSVSKASIKNSLIRNLIKLSSQMDEENNEKVSRNLIDCAKIIQNNKLPIKELYFLTKEILSYNEFGLKKEAQALTDINLDFSDITNGLQQVSAWFKSIQNSIMAKHEYLQKHPKTQVFIKQLGDIWKQVGQLSAATDSQIAKIQQSTQAMQGQMGKELTPQSIMVGNKPVNIQWEDDPTEPGYQRAVVMVNNKKYEVQEDETGKRSLKEILDYEVVEDIPEVPQEKSPVATPQQPQAQPTSFNKGQKVKFRNQEYFVVGTDPKGNIQLGRDPNKPSMTINPNKLLQENPPVKSFNLKTYKLSQKN